MKAMGTWLILAGIAVIIVGVLMRAGWLSWLGQLPGDIRIEGENVRFYLPLATMVVISVVLTLLLNLFKRL